ncbi:16S rRNA (guanine(527)-N(7))-methyltransferase RsmG [Roseovarius nanhaiticus]|uniref:Ribosomal RNA small subunit methyltransferase G n=1 Tax=Roseovarius nanhaiticus TaxID=573024 RepID=A0A1N7EH18_9RHOB|nr:16S rRNA (guanine(527)-N(7))-methyltransferase RsmG [Roseovarius nanhaiticus]SEK74780.1 16S rRNA (guanine527-N7)-methyltransferase [Roseovarius nanhaiticus]SIR87376.1 16S rRNA (guanine527-N7)-methyltransferase [Roseovarius nanhaiticus]
MTADLDVSRETMDRLRAFEQIVKKWTPKINLVSRDSAYDIWGRHIADSVQLFEAVSPDRHTWVDLGSGGGFPGVVVAILAHGSDTEVTMVESDGRKCAFLRAALRETGVDATVLNQRIEQVEPQNADVVSARALADLTTLLGYAERHLTQGGTAVFAKGAMWPQEVEAARSQWNFDLEAVKSKLVPEAAILKISGVSRV